MEEIKKEFEGENIWMKKDIEIIQNLVTKLNKSESRKTEILGALEELEYLVHQIDNARDLDSIGGLQLVVNMLNQTDDEIQSQAAYVIGSAAQRYISYQKPDISILFLFPPLLYSSTKSLANTCTTSRRLSIVGK
jgi:nucleotide exchange factor SIL1